MIRYRCSYDNKQCRQELVLELNSWKHYNNEEIEVFGFQGEYGRKFET